MSHLFRRAVLPLTAGILVAGFPAVAQAAPVCRTPDIVAPSAPTGFGVAPGPAGRITLIWNRATDDRKVTAYQVFLNGFQVGTVTGTVFQQPTPPPMALLYAVRAVDAAGNLSPYAALNLGWPPDATSPSAPGRISLSTTSGLIRTTWIAATDDRLVAGYEVRLNGTVANVTSATSTDLPFSGPGVYNIMVRAFDTAGRYGPPAYQYLAGDPVPPLPTPPAVS